MMEIKRNLPSTRYFFVWLWCLLTMGSFLAGAIRIAPTGNNIVTDTYHSGSVRFFEQDNPYRVPLEKGDQFEYSPTFALFYGIFASLPTGLESLAWLAINIGIFWAGLIRWLPRSFPSMAFKERSILLVALLVTSFELNISVLYQQINALIIGMSLLGFSYLRDKKWALASITITLACNWKPLPIIFIAPCILFLPKKAWGYFAVSAGIVLLLPMMVVGWENNFQLHLAWIDSVNATLNLTRSNQADIKTVVSFLGYPTAGQILQPTILVLSAAILFLLAWKRQYCRPEYLALASATLILVSPRSESPTFVFVAPALVLLILATEFDKKAIFVLGVASFFLTIIYTDLWPKSWLLSWRHESLSKAIGTLLIWLVSLVWTINQSVKLLKNAKS